MPALSSILDSSAWDVTTIVGAGGKTTLLWLLAERRRQIKTLVTTTTKIGWPPASRYDAYLGEEPPGGPAAGPPPRPGITLAGCELWERGVRKLSSLSPATLERVRGRYDRVLIEGDGSRNLPLKGWAGHEPVIPAYTACTVAVVTLWPLGCPADEGTVFRLPLFCRISGAVPGETLTLEHIISAVRHPEGLLKGSRGERILFINQVEDDRAAAAAEKLTAGLTAGGPPPELAMIVAGSARQDRGRVLWER